MAENNGFDRWKGNLSDIKKQLEDQRKMQQELEKGLGGYFEALAKVNQLQKDITHLKQKEAEEAKKLKDEEKQLKDLKEKQKKQNGYLSNKEKEILKTLKQQVKYRKKNLDYLEEQTKELEKQTEEISKSVRKANLLKAGFKTTGKVIGWAVDKIKKSGIFEMDREIRNAARSMGIGNKQYEAFATNMNRAADSTTMMGVNIKELAKLQRGYSEEIGRSVKLTEGGLKAMAGMSQGTGLGAEFAVQMAASADDFGMSVEASAKLVEDTMNTAGEMGVNSSKAASTLQKNLKLAQKYGFKGGVKALGKMSADALRLKLDMDGIAGMAEKVFRPEGAIEMAAQLSTMGGEFAKLGNPMQLMFKARNDFEGFAKDIGKAAGEFVKFNKESGTFEVKGGLARDRLREISKITGIGVEELTKMAEAQKRVEAIGQVSPISMNEKDKELVSSLAKFNQESGQWEINVGTFSRDVKDLKKADLESIKTQKQSLEERAKQARTFDDTINDTIQTLKQQFLDVAIKLKEFVGEPLQNFVENLKNSGFLDRLKDFVKGAVELAGTLVKWITDNPIKTAFIAGSALLLKTVGGFLWDSMKWYANGMMLGKGFNTVANVGGGGGGGSDVGGGNMLSRFLRGGKKGGMRRNLLAKATKIGNKGGFGFGGTMKLGKSLAKGTKAFTGLGAVALAADVGRGFMDDPDSNLGKSIGVAGKAAEYAGYGALLGSVIPGLGNVAGGVIGGLIGGGMGIYDEFFGDKNKGTTGRKGGDISNVSDGIIQFNPKDKFMKVNDVLLASTQEGKLDKAAKEFTGNNGGKSEVIHKHENQKIDININGLGSDTSLANLIVENIVNNAYARQTLNNGLKDTSAGTGRVGKLNPNPRFAT
jgi:hypothetical protein